MVGPIVNGQEHGSITGKDGPKKDGNTLVAPDNVIINEQAARTVYDRLRKNHRKRCWTYERIQGMLDGNPPYNPAALRRAGLSDMSNVNWKDGDSIYRSVALAYWSLFNDVQNIAEFGVDFGDDPGLKAQWGQILSEEWDRTIRSWPEFNKHMSFHQSEVLKFGISLILWPDENSWQFKPINVKSFLVPDQTNNSIEDLTLLIAEQEYTAQFLWNVWEQAKERPNSEWDADSLGDLLLRLANISDQERRSRGINDCADLQKLIRNGDLFYDALYNDNIQLCSIFSKEFDNKISHHIIHPDLATENPLFFADRQYDSIRDAMIYFTFMPGEETIHSNKGLGHNIFSAVEAITQLDCSVLDQGKRAGSLLIKSGPSRGKDDRQIRFVHGGVIDVGEAEIEQNSMGNNVAQTVEVSRYFKQKIFANNNISGQDPAFADRNIQSARQIQIQATKEARIQKNMIAHYYDTLDHFFRELVRKMLWQSSGDAGYEYVKIWKDRCISRGVPPELFEISKAELQPNGLPEYLEINATRSAGSGSQIADQIEMKEVMAILPTLGERGRIAALRDFISAFRGFRYVDRYFPVEDQDKQPVGADTIASIENNQLSEGKQIIVSPDNNHPVHIPNHIRLMRDYMDLYNQDSQAQFDQTTNILQKVDDVFSVTVPHTVKHLFFLQSDPTRRTEFEKWNAEFAVLANFGDQIAHNAQRQRESEARKAQELQQAQAEQDAQNTPEHIKARGEIERKDKKLNADIQRDKVRDSYKFALEREKIANKDVLDKYKTIKELSIKAAKELADTGKPNA